MKTGGREHVELVAMFERDQTFVEPRRFDKEPREDWDCGRIYQCGLTNSLFLAYRRGYAFAKACGVMGS